MGLLVIISVVFVSEYLYLNFYSSKNMYLSPIPQATPQNSGNSSKDIQNQIITGLNSLNISYTGVTKNQDGSFNVNLKDSGVAIIAPNKDIKLQLSSLQLMLSRLTIEGKKLRILDFRYNRPFVSF